MTRCNFSGRISSRAPAEVHSVRQLPVDRQTLVHEGTYQRGSVVFGNKSAVAKQPLY